VPNAANPQDLNRYSYVRNNPIRYTDPSGHFICSNDRTIDDYCPGRTSIIGSNGSSGGGGYTPPCTRNCNPPKGGGGGGGPVIPVVPSLPGSSSGDPVVSVVPAGAVCEATSCTQELPSGICPLGESCSANNPPGFWVDWYGVANLSQDLATTISGIGAGAELTLVAIGCAYQGLPGCGEGVLLARFVWVGTGLNGVETGLGGVSLGSTIVADFQDDGNFGEATRTSAATFVAGFITTDPIIDLAIDGYASGYNRGYFCGVDTIISCLGNP
jgi:hypothetical protein